MNNKVHFVVDGGHGSSGKGAVATRLADIYDIRNFTSTNLPNAGHTAIVNDFKFVSKILPTPLVLARKYPKKSFRGYVGASASFTLEQFKKEVVEVGINDNVEVLVHPRAPISSDRHSAMEAPGGIWSTEHISSTMSGSGAVSAEKMMRFGTSNLFRDTKEFETLGYLGRISTFRDPHFFSQHLRGILDSEDVIHEVSQGYALSLNWGTHYPQCTSRDCTPLQGMNDLGLLPKHAGDVYLNLRTFPIRVGNNYKDGVEVGNSGGWWWDQQETTWDQIGRDAEMPDEERENLKKHELTTVTKKLRRTATFSYEWLRIAAEGLGANKIIINFPQYLHWSCHKMRGGREQLGNLHPKVRDFIERVEMVANLPVVMLCTGAEHEDYIWME